jgi:hypothetical protein
MLTFPVLAALGLFVFSLNAEDMSQRYAQIALPLVALGIAPALRRKWAVGGALSAATIVGAHLLFEVMRR